jgi:fido (protein-threonine AMPylation protein)
MKKELRQINKKLKIINYQEVSLSDKVKLNIDFARRHLVENIYKQAVLEGVAATYLDTETIVEGGKVNNMTPTDVLKIVNLKHAWEFILNKAVLTSPTNYAILCEINKLVEEGFYYNAGKIRNVPVSIGGTNWKPSLPIETVVKEELLDIINSKLQIVDKAIELLLYIMKRQVFIDGNKRTAVIYANHLLISNGKGLIVIPNDLVTDYRSLLIDYYEGTDGESIKVFLKEKCYMEI